MASASPAPAPINVPGSESAAAGTAPCLHRRVERYLGAAVRTDHVPRLHLRPLPGGFKRALDFVWTLSALRLRADSTPILARPRHLAHRRAAPRDPRSQHRPRPPCCPCPAAPAPSPGRQARRPLSTLASHASSTSSQQLSGKAASLMSVTVHESQIMPAYAASTNDLASFDFSSAIAPLPVRSSADRSPVARENGDALSHGGPARMSPKTANGPSAMQAVPNGRTKPPGSDKPALHQEAPTKSPESRRGSSELGPRDDGHFASVYTTETTDRMGTTQVKMGHVSPVEGTNEARKDFIPPLDPSAPPPQPQPQPQPSDASATLVVPQQPHRVSSPPTFNHNASAPPQPPHRLQHRHTLEVPKASTARPRDSQPTDDVITASGRFSPTTDRRRRASMSLVRRNTRSVNSDMHLDDVPQDEDAARWAEHIRQKRASKRKRKEDEDEDRVVVGTKVDQNHVNWVTAYNMLTGIRFTVSRTNAKMDRELTDADFDAKHKFSFDITGNELTPSAKYDFKFKDYAPWVFRRLRATFKLDPADYLVSLTSKYILSELGSPGKSGSFFYFSRDYKYIIKTIHHAEHKFLRKILKDYYNHVQENPNTLLSQFYGLHRVKIPYGRKIHFVVMNNLFPPHRDIHTTFDLKGSTIGRDFKEEDLAANPRATLKDLNWLRRSLHLEFGPTKKEMFIHQMKKDVKLLQRLHIMDYSLLIGIHDLEKGNEENLRDKTLQVFQPGGEEELDPRPNMLMRTPSKLENARKARELRQMVKTQKPVPMEQTLNKMPDELQDPKPEFYFYSDDGGFRATHEDNAPGEEIYYLGIIDCLTHYSIIKRMEHFFKGLANTESQISAIPPDRYGDRFVKFISGVTKTKEAAEREKEGEEASSPINESLTAGFGRSSTDRVMQKAEHQAEKSRQRGRSEDSVPHRELKVLRSPSAERGEMGTSLPVVEEAGESSSVGGRSNRSTIGETKAGRAVNGDYLTAGAGPPTKDTAFLGPPEPTSAPRSQSPSKERDQSHGRPPPTPPKDFGAVGPDEQRPPTPPKDEGYLSRHTNAGPPTPPKEERGRTTVAKNKELPRTPLDISVN